MVEHQRVAEVLRELDRLLDDLWRMPVQHLPEDFDKEIDGRTQKWLRIGEAAQRLGVSQDRVRHRSGEPDPSPRSLSKMAAPTDGDGDNPGGEAETGGRRNAGERRDAVAVLCDVLDLLGAQLADRAREVEQLHVLLQQAQALALPDARRPWWSRLTRRGAPAS